ncbi:hypothetical protein, partial [Rossellomorea marisflavi]|uniref:hypothetical protein n=1 Tax=Rossellomorea marisflavi TaxID=189381 RepID=UPI00064FCB92
LKNIPISDFKEFFREKKVKGRTVRIKDDSTVGKYSKILALITEELEDSDGSFKESDISSFLFEKLFYDNNNYEFVLKYNEFFAGNSARQSDAEMYLQANASLKFNESLTKILKFNGKYELCSTKLECKAGIVSALHMLVWIGSVKEYNGDVNFYAGITVDVENKVIIIRLNFRQLELFDKEPLKLLKDLKDILCGSGVAGKNFVPLKLNVVSLNEDTASRAIFTLYEELSSEAEALLNSKIKKGTEEKIRDFLKTMGISEIKEEYLEQIKAVIYQDIAKSIKPSTFNQGWIFRFDFREGDHTRATSKNEERGPVYTSKTYWQLKELIYEEETMYEAGFHWKMPGTSEFVDVKIIARNDTIIVHYYYNMRKDRKEKDEFVIRKVAEHIS